MNKIIIVIVALFLHGCKSISSCFIIELDQLEPQPQDTKLLRTLEFQREIDRIIAIDAENKKWERIFIKEIKAAKKHDDLGAYHFFLEEYINLERLILPEWIKKEPGYIKEITLEELQNIK